MERTSVPNTYYKIHVSIFRLPSQQREFPSACKLKLLLDCDGEYSGSSVEMFAAMEPDVQGLTKDPETRFEYSAIPGQALDIEGYENPTELAQWRCSENREVVILMRRGPGVMYDQDGLLLDGGIKKLLNRLSVEELMTGVHYLETEKDLEQLYF